MNPKSRKASLSKGRKSYCVIFTHPQCTAPDGKGNLRVRRGLGTTDPQEAQRYVDQLNELLADEGMWEISKRETALKRFDKKIVDAFYDPMTASSLDLSAIRNDMIPYPEGFTKVLLVGTTGAGKTTLVRQLLGVAPDEAFPSISTAKTTTFDSEYILRDGSFQAVVTFTPKGQVEQYVSDCVFEAILATINGGNESTIARKLCEHVDQRFRLHYILGDPRKLLCLDATENEEEDEEFDDAISEVEIKYSEGDNQQSDLSDNLREILTLIKQLAVQARIDAASNQEDTDAIGSSETEIFENLEEYLAVNKYAEFNEIVDKIIDDCEARFDNQALSQGQLERGKDNWPIKWYYEEDDKKRFIKTVKWFTSNEGRYFGHLLTPLVQGIRIAGPFAPNWYGDSIPKLVIWDGQGIGHTADSTSSISTSITERFESANAIVLVDNASQPMQAGSCAVLRCLGATGHSGKMILAFTRFDQVVGDNFSDRKSKKDHVLNSFDNAVSAIGKEDRDSKLALSKAIPEKRVFFLANIQKKDVHKATENELKSFLAKIESIDERIPESECKPCYDMLNLAFAAQKAADEFHKKWRNMLVGEHFSRPKALTRRIGVYNRDEYDTLRPVADMIQLLQLYISRFLETPCKWVPFAPTIDSPERIDTLNAIKRKIFASLHSYCRKRMIEEHTHEWKNAYLFRGAGSASHRMQSILAIYQKANPIPNETPDNASYSFLSTLKSLIVESIESEKGVIEQ